MARARATILEVNSEFPEPRRIQQAAAKLNAGDVIGYPTDGLYALGADLQARNAVDRLYALRRLDKKKALSVVCGDLSQASQYAIIDDARYRVLRRLLPGPYTIILPATREAPKTGDAKRRAVGIRVPDHPVALSLLTALGRPILSTTAVIPPEEDEDNLGTGESPIGRASADPIAVADFFGEGLGLVVASGILSGAPSSVIDWTDDEPVIKRRGIGDLSLLEA